MNRAPKMPGKTQRITRVVPVATAFVVMTAPLSAADLHLHWRQLPPIPDPIGLAGPFAGVSGGALILAGGANFPDKLPWEGGRKMWCDKGFVLDPTNGAWRSSFKLPRPVGSSSSVACGEHEPT